MNVTKDVLHALRRDLYPPTRCVWAEEVPVPTEDKPRRMDAAAIDTGIKDMTIHGFEVKVSRADWRNDMDGEKSKPASRETDRFWFVFGSPDIYKPEEVPSYAGIIHIEGGVAVVARQAPYGTLLGNNMDLRAAMRRILQRTVRMEDNDFVSKVKRDAEQKGYAKGKSAAKRASPYVRARGGATKLRYDPGRISAPEPDVGEDGNFCP